MGNDCCSGIQVENEINQETYYPGYSTIKQAYYLSDSIQPQHIVYSTSQNANRNNHPLTPHQQHQQYFQQSKHQQVPQSLFQTAKQDVPVFPRSQIETRNSSYDTTQYQQQHNQQTPQYAPQSAYSTKQAEAPNTQTSKYQQSIDSYTKMAQAATVGAGAAVAKTADQPQARQYVSFYNGVNSTLIDQIWEAISEKNKFMQKIDFQAALGVARSGQNATFVIVLMLEDRWENQIRSFIAQLMNANVSPSAVHLVFLRTQNATNNQTYASLFLGDIKDARAKEYVQMCQVAHFMVSNTAYGYKLREESLGFFRKRF